MPSAAVNGKYATVMYSQLDHYDAQPVIGWLVHFTVLIIMGTAQSGFICPLTKQVGLESYFIAMHIYMLCPHSM
jgi:hypothetical protein